MSQTELATLMRAQGHRWAQQTVVAVEKGARSLRLAEAFDLAAILGVPVADLERDENGRVAAMRSQVRILMEADRRFSDSTRALIAARWEATRWLDETYPPDETGQIPEDGWNLTDPEFKVLQVLQELIDDIEPTRLVKDLYAFEGSGERKYTTWRLERLRAVMLKVLGYGSHGVDQTEA